MHTWLPSFCCSSQSSLVSHCGLQACRKSSFKSGWCIFLFQCDVAQRNEEHGIRNRALNVPGRMSLMTKILSRTLYTNWRVKAIHYYLHNLMTSPHMCPAQSTTSNIQNSSLQEVKYRTQSQHEMRGGWDGRQGGKCAKGPRASQNLRLITLRVR